VVDDSRGPAFLPPDNKIRGGSRLLAEQARCPFNAFAQWRLGAEPLGEPQSGLGADLRGMLVHDSMELLWREFSNQGKLSILDDGTVHETIDAAVSQALTHLFRNNNFLSRSDFGERLLLLEKQRLVALLGKWLQIEKERPDFDVESLEKTVALEFDGLSISLRLDRVDRVAGGLVIIDYKTGRTRLAALARDRLTEPQLALYALAMDETPVAVTYAAIRRKKIGFDGLACSDDILPGCQSLAAAKLPEDWNQTIAQWRQQLLLVMDELRVGRADVTFYDPEASAYSAYLEPLNRLAGVDDVTALKRVLSRENSQ